MLKCYYKYTNGGDTMRLLVSIFLIFASVFFAISFSITKISVLLSTELDSSGATKGYIFNELRIECVSDVFINNQQFEKDSKITIKPGTNGLIVNDSETDLMSIKIIGKIRILSAKRSYGVPTYEDTILVKIVDKGIVAINELDIENYVKYVVPSEVPNWFEKEAVKAQAVIARSRAVADILKGPNSAYYGANCDDSTKSQVFNNQVISEIIKNAVEETRGQIMVINNQPLEEIVYFSTSCGFTSNNEEVWSDQKGNFPGEAIPYLRAKQQFVGCFAEKDKTEDFWNKFFKAFWGVEKELLDFFDRESPWFRWKVTITREELEIIISKGLIAREKADRTLGIDAVRTLGGIPLDPDNSTFSIGELKNIEVVRRGEGGVIMTLRITAENGIYEVDKEYNIRFIIRPTKTLTALNRDIIIERHDGSTYSNYSILPSGYFTFDIERENGKIKQITFYGGGNGHGVGMSQYGANYLAKNGKSYLQILETFYEGKVEKIENIF